MKIKKVGWTSFLLSADSITVLTDPLKLLEVQKNVPKTKADICLFTNYDKDIKKSIVKDNKLDKKIVTDNRESIMEISIPGEYEVGGLMIRRGIGDDFFIIDEGTLRIVYMGDTDNSFDPKEVSDLGDVDVLIVPVGDGVNFMSFEKLEKVFSNTDPAILIPCAYKEENEENDKLKSKEEFIKYFGFPNVRDENYLNVDKKKVEKDQQSVEVVFLQ
jgi:hypothetical protein